VPKAASRGLLFAGFWLHGFEQSSLGDAQAHSGRQLAVPVVELAGGICYKALQYAAPGRATGVRAMRTRFLSLACCSAVAAFAGASLAQADTLLVDRVKQERGLGVPSRGMTMSQVERRYGAPRDKLAPAGGDTRLHPVINRWVYDSYIVYFERDRVISSVASRATPTEVGPKGVAGTQ
jgi:hypothetical protein